MTTHDNNSISGNADVDLKPWQMQHLKNQLHDEIDVPEKEETKLSADPDSQIQAIVKDVFQELNGVCRPDMFDTFYENHELEEYTHTHLLLEFLDDVLDRLHVTVSVDRDASKKEEVTKKLYSVAENINGNGDNIDTVRNAIDEKWPELVTTETTPMSPDEYHAHVEKQIERQVKQLAQGIDSQSKYSDYFKEFEAVNNNDMDDIAKQLNTMVDLGHDVWKLVLYSSQSGAAQKFRMGNRKTRSSLHTLFIGDISTAKSKALGIVNDITPKSDNPTDMTKASFIGAYDTESKEIKDGVVDRVQDGNLIIEEYDKITKDDGVMRVVFDNSDINIPKGQDVKYIPEVRTSVLAGANPKGDFFTSTGEALRGQIPFNEGELSRFDVLIPLVNTEKQMAEYASNMSLFGNSQPVDMDSIKNTMHGLATKIQSVNNIEITPEQEQKVVDAFNELQESFNDNDYRPTLLIMRDLETLARLVYIIACVNRSVHNEYGTVKVMDEDIEEAVSQFETLVNLRKRLYTDKQPKSVATTTKDRIYSKLVQLSDGGNWVEKATLKNTCVQDDIVCKKTVYNKINALIREKRVVEEDDEDKERYTRIKPVAQT